MIDAVIVVFVLGLGCGWLLAGKTGTTGRKLAKCQWLGERTWREK